MPALTVDDFSFNYIFICLASLYLVIFSIIFFKIIIAIFWKIVHFFRYLFVDIIWGHIVRFAKFLWNSVIKPVWGWIKEAYFKVYGFIARVVNKIIDIVKNIFNIGKRVTSKVVEVTESAYHFVEKTAINIFHIGEDIVIKGVNIVKAIYNFLKEKFIEAYDIIRTIIEDGIDFFKGVGEFFTGILDSILNIF